ncbi:hypothetical protein M2283_001929 [Streptomyces pseudovenezuelae]|uniref:Uncharacterized protein n=1 Tax=Streptomyces pseudovenezuelae TaxID=67350 RepID=A0ABT6LG86_9ACTN|nr:hypothetical protein [Streptomyces pseudovenezuelae]
MFGRPPHAFPAQAGQLPNGTFPALSGNGGTPRAARASAVCSGATPRMSVGWVMLETSNRSVEGRLGKSGPEFFGERWGPLLA